VFVTHDQSEALSLSDRLAVMSEGRIRQVGTPAEIYRRPCERFVASFVGDTNVLRARIESIDATWAIVALGAARIRVASAPLRNLAVSAAVDLFVRPEQLRLTELNESCASKGTIVAQVYQGGHVDIYLECADSAGGRVLARLSGPEAVASRPIGAPVGVSLNTDEAIAFAIA
jgi:ABC-type Fe3+/spermidine/putrescine transport system ATPase subunit